MDSFLYSIERQRDERNTQGDGEWAQSGSGKGKWNTVSGRMGISAALIGPGPVGKRKAELGTENAEDRGKGYCVELYGTPGTGQENVQGGMENGKAALNVTD